MVNSILDKGLKFLNKQGVKLITTRVAYSISGADYDDEVSQTITGSSVISGLLFPVVGQQGSQEALLLEQGKIKTSDKHIFLLGSINISGNLLFTIGSDNYTLIPDGIKVWENAGSHIFSEAFVRFSIPGSLF